jgi:hypothetical protein
MINLNNITNAHHHELFTALRILLLFHLSHCEKNTQL